MIIIHR